MFIFKISSTSPTFIILILLFIFCFKISFPLRGRGGGTGSSLVARQVKDLALSLLWLGLLLWYGFDPWPGEVPHAKGAAKK